MVYCRAFIERERIFDIGASVTRMIRPSSSDQSPSGPYGIFGTPVHSARSSKVAAFGQ